MGKQREEITILIDDAELTVDDLNNITGYILKITKKRTEDNLKID